MTAISAATSVSSYSYGKHPASASEEILSSNTVSSAKATKSGQLDEDTSSSADKLLSQLMTLSMNRFSDPSGSGEDEDGGEGMDVAQLDSDGDGYVSKAEFVAARPSDVTEDQAGTLFDSFDSEGAGSLSVDALTEAVSVERSQRSEGLPPPPPAEDDQSQSLLSDLDTNGDGLVTLDEFMASKPEDVAASQASQLFDLLDTSDTGSLSVQSAG
ncbi:EF-hand domain-containing protein [Rhizobium sophorae]|uniref:EF-hand domain-containing protein n=1 Tax=Rhizobium sophorae TaxID=1535242 RepID=A0A7Y3WCF7_9HYPH|nr:EF-hand domain-containing protein [Rhizobium sophorae]MBX4861982.1 EF-hand domain-containing protein [Rhizobium bangladeshense]NKL36257.1 EF-hand domain-containing protein [Rhizobium leguminosarum bv. viciae]NNU35305.1 EF-hand domain-containing protein [Rhizobium sophorae]